MFFIQYILITFFSLPQQLPAPTYTGSCLLSPERKKDNYNSKTSNQTSQREENNETKVTKAKSAPPQKKANQTKKGIENILHQPTISGHEASPAVWLESSDAPTGETWFSLFSHQVSIANSFVVGDGALCLPPSKCWYF